MLAGRRKDYMNDLCRWADKADAKKLRKAIEKDPLLVNKFDSQGYGPLHYAAAAGSTECVQLLLEFGAKVNECVRYGEPTALHAALHAKQEATSLLLLKNGANPELTHMSNNGFTLAAEMGKRFELEFRELAKKNQNRVKRQPPPSSAPTSTLSQAPKQPQVPVPSGEPSSPSSASAAAAAASAANKRQQMRPAEIKPVSPADAAMNALSMLGISSPTESPSRRDPDLHPGRLQPTQQQQAKIDERKAALEKRMRKCDVITRALEPYEDITDVHSPEVRNAVLALGFSADSLSDVSSSAPVTKVNTEKTQAKKPALKRTGGPGPSTPTGPAPSPSASAVSPRAPASTAQKTVRPPPVSVPAKMATPEEAAEAIIKHFKSWFDPSLGRVNLPAWYPVVEAQANAGGALKPSGAMSPSREQADSVNSPTLSPSHSANLVALTDILLQWSKHVCGLPIASKDFDIRTLKERNARQYFEDFRTHHQALSIQVEMQKEMLGDSYQDTKINVDILRDRVINLLDQYSTVALRHEDPAGLLLANMQIIGATYFTFQSMFSSEILAIVASIKEYVSAVLNLGKQEDSEEIVADMCMKLNGIVNSLVFRCSSGEIAKELSSHVATIAITTRAMVTDCKQGRPKKNEYNVTIGTHLSKMKELLRTAARAHRGDQLSAKDETHIFEMSGNYLSQALAFYKTILTSSDGREVTSAVDKLVPLVRKFAELALRSREVTLNSWGEVLQSALDLSDGVCHFCDDTVNNFDDPFSLFDTAILICKQYVLQVILSISALSADNAVIPRHQISLSLRALSIHLVTILDLFYISS